MDKQKRLVFIILILLGLALLLGIGALIVSRSPLGGQLSRISALQQEILRINKLADDYQPDPALKQDMANVAALITSDNVKIEAERSNITGDKVLPKSIAEQVAGPDAKNLLESASNRGQLGAEYAEIVSELLEEIAELAAESQADAKRSDLETILRTTQSNCESLISQLRS